jgi:hypothetical protein
MRADFRVMRDIAQRTRINPRERVHELESFVKKMNHLPEAAKVSFYCSEIFSEQFIDNMIFS